MKYYSLNRKAPQVGFKEALIRGLAPDRGLYFPAEIPRLPADFIEDLTDLSDQEMAFRAIQQYVGDAIPEERLRSIIDETLCFEFPVRSLSDRISVLELFHGPTLAFKDVGARFMARCLGYFNENDAESTKITVLVATSGDTGGAVASGFFGVEGVDVVILYPSGKVSAIQEKQLTTFGGNIKAIEVDGTFDDCQRMVKKAFLDPDLSRSIKLTSANSINIARWMPQMFYYFSAYRKLKKPGKELVFSVPSGNFGNICAGMLAQKMGLPIDHFITGTNENRIVPEFLETGEYRPKPSVATISNAMDVGDPSNFVRIQEIYEGDVEKLRKNLSGYSYTDAQTLEIIGKIYDEKGYILDPHGAIGYMALQEYLNHHREKEGVFLETAHPVKFLDVLPEPIAGQVVLPDSIKTIMPKEKQSSSLDTYSELVDYLLS